MVRLALAGTLIFASILMIFGWTQTSTTTPPQTFTRVAGTGSLPNRGTTTSSTGPTRSGHTAPGIYPPVAVAPGIYSQIAGAPVAHAPGTNGMLYVVVPTAGGQQVVAPVVNNPRPVGTAGSTAGGPARVVSPAQAVPRVADADLLRAARQQLRSEGGFTDDALDVDVRRGIILVTTRNRADRDRAFLIAREVHGAIGVFVW